METQDLLFGFLVHIRDPNNIPHTIKNLKITMRDMNMQLPQAVTARKMMNDVVASTQPQLAEGGRGNVVTFGSYDLQLSGMDGKITNEMWLTLLPVFLSSVLVTIVMCMFTGKINSMYVICIINIFMIWRRIRSILSMNKTNVY